MPRFDPNDTGVFPPRPPRAWTDAAHTRAMPERLMTRARGFDRAPGDAPAPGAAFDWVPTAEYEARHFVRASTAEIPVRALESTPLELFDDPVLELKTPEQWLATSNAGRGPVRSVVEILHGPRAVHLGAVLGDGVRRIVGHVRDRVASLARGSRG